MSLFSKTGASYKMKRQPVASPLHLGGIIERAIARVRTDSVQEPGTGSHQLALNKVSAIYPSLEFTMKVQRLENYLADYDDSNLFCFIDGEAAQDIANNTLYYTDGLEIYKFASGVINSCRLTIPNSGSIKAAIDYLGYNPTEPSYGSNPSAISDAVLTKTNLNTLTIGGTSVKDDFRQVEITVNHNARQEILGTSKLPSDLIQRHTVYTVRVARALKTQSWTANALNNTTQTIQIQINDNQGSTRKTLFTFTAMEITVKETQVNELDIILENITCTGKALTLQAGV